MSCVAAALLTMSRLVVRQSGMARLTGSGDWHQHIRVLMGVLILLACLSLLAAGLVRQPAWRRWYVVSAISQGMLTVLAAHRLIALSPWQHLGLFSVIVGLVLLVLRPWGWYREPGRTNDMCTFGMSIG